MFFLVCWAKLFGCGTEFGKSALCKGCAFRTRGRACETVVLLAGHFWAWMFVKVVTWRVRGAWPFFTDKGNGVGSGYVLVNTQEALA